MNVQQKIRATSFIDDQTLSVLEKVALVLASSALIVLSGKIMVPFWPVAMTMQTFAVIALGVVLGPRLALAAALTYLLEGAAGLPVFADSLSYPGLAALTKPSAGFLLSFPLAAYAAGYLAERGWTQSWLKATALFVVCETIIYASGMTWLMTMIGMDLAIKNMMLWMPGEIAKIGLGVTGTRLYKKIKDSKCA